MDNNQLLAALSMDLKRMALGIHNKSYAVSDRFFAEAIKRKNEVDHNTLLPYMKKLLEEISTLGEMDMDHRADNALMYSTRIQNYVLHRSRL